MLTPILCLVIILAIKLLAESFVSGTPSAPTYLYFADNTNGQVPVPGVFPPTSCKIVYEYGSSDASILSEFNGKTGMMESLPLPFKSAVCQDFDNKTVPYFRDGNYTSIRGMGEAIAKDITDLNKLPLKDVNTSTLLPDGAIYIENLTDKSFTGHISINNILYDKYHRDNGVTVIHAGYNPDIRHNKKGRAKVIPSEGMISMMNLFTNGHINKYLKKFGGKETIVETIVSPLVNGSVSLGFIQSMILLVSCT